MPNVVVTPTDQELKLAQFFVDDCGFMGPSEDGSRLSSGHQWHRRHPSDERFFLLLAERAIESAEREAYDHYHPRG